MQQQGYFRSNQRLISIIQILLDTLLICLAFILSYHFYQGDVLHIPKSYIFIMLSGAAGFYIIAITNHLYNSWRTDELYRHLSRVTQTWFFTITALLILGWALKNSYHYSRLVIGSWFILTPIFLSLSRYAIRQILSYLRSQGRNTRRIAIAGDSLAAKAFIAEIQKNEWMGYVIQGRYNDDINSELSSSIYAGNFEKLISDVKNHLYDEVFIALPMSAEPIIIELVSALSDTSIPVQIIPDLFTFNLMNARMTRVGSIPTISVFDSPHDDLSGALKRSEDVILSMLILILICPLMILIALAIKLSSKGPVLFKQRRYGIGGNQISVWKFRSMTVCEDKENIPQAQKNDARITKLGAILRKTSLDELPQFFNVLQGQMSIVGPRPHAVAHNEIYRKDIPGYMLRHLVKPGITGWAQINGWRGETDTLDKMEKRIEFDLAYIKNWSIFFDLKIIALTIIKGFINKNAY